jgi:micrococcal nuclease
MKAFSLLTMPGWAIALAVLMPAQPVQSGNCDRAYPTVCIPSPPPDLDCKEIPHRNFQVVAPDPHGFDGDKDGIGCEKR